MGRLLDVLLKITVFCFQDAADCDEMDASETGAAELIQLLTRSFHQLLLLNRIRYYIIG